MIALSIAMNAAALAFLRFAWGRKYGGGVMFAGWFCFAAALLLWTLRRGESGLAESVLAFCTLGAAYIVALFVSAPSAAAGAGAPRPARQGSAFRRRAALFAVSALAASAAMLALAALWFVLASRAHWPPENAIVGAAVLATLAWPLIFGWLLMEERTPRRLFVVSGIVALGVGALVLS